MQNDIASVLFDHIQIDGKLPEATHLAYWPAQEWSSSTSPEVDGDEKWMEQQQKKNRAERNEETKCWPGKQLLFSGLQHDGYCYEKR